ncbi:hypothetical protein K437DRAFT_276093 [Tilletiaria anomala UBC 951]|uniref:Uncharacterized protein n=1 Tax=Tilletiaria anomala (strain ATCC 24038 / CBS 436.72 / UBC 951) TaxID=1037660 RepID=A0A066VCF3_TILAU|nr:uncharacterized protein K437DRAFT_276093 [Tilletiaria anomala UBC 951]KDN39156.1 hypothetical protein K437DRAFT_276093 [Tilletiaria anomala UBC 951]
MHLEDSRESQLSSVQPWSIRSAARLPAYSHSIGDRALRANIMSRRSARTRTSTGATTSPARSSPPMDVLVQANGASQSVAASTNAAGDENGQGGTGAEVETRVGSKRKRPSSPETRTSAGADPGTAETAVVKSAATAASPTTRRGPVCPQVPASPASTASMTAATAAAFGAAAAAAAAEKLKGSANVRVQLQPPMFSPGHVPGPAATSVAMTVVPSSQELTGEEESVPSLQALDACKPNKLLRNYALSKELDAREGRVKDKDEDGDASLLADGGDATPHAKHVPQALVIKSQPHDKDDLLLRSEDAWKLKVVFEKLERELRTDVLHMHIPGTLEEPDHEHEHEQEHDSEDQMEHDTEAGDDGASASASPTGRASRGRGRWGRRGKRGSRWTTRKQHVKSRIQQQSHPEQPGHQESQDASEAQAEGDEQDERARNGTDAIDPLPVPRFELGLPFSSIEEALSRAVNAAEPGTRLSDLNDASRAAAAQIRHDQSSAKLARAAKSSAKMDVALTLEAFQQRRKEDEQEQRRASSLSVLCVLDSFIHQLGRRYRTTEPRPFAGREGEETIVALETPGMAVVPQMTPASDIKIEPGIVGQLSKREKDVEDLLLSLAKEDALSRAKHESTHADENPKTRNTPRYAQYALHMRLTGGDYFTNARFLEEEDALALETGEADLVHVQPTSLGSKSNGRSVPTLGERVLRNASLRPPVPSADEIRARREQRVVGPTHLYYGPCASFAPSYDTTNATLSFGGSITARLAKKDPRTLELGRKWVRPNPQDLLNQFEELEDDGDEASEEQEVQGDVRMGKEPAPIAAGVGLPLPPPPPPNELSSDAVEKLGDIFDPDALRAAYAQAVFQQRVEEKLRANMALIGKLQEMQWERLRAHEKEFWRDPLLRNTEQYLQADGRESALAHDLLESLAELLGMRPHTLGKGKARNALPKRKTFAAAVHSNAIDPALLDDNVDSGYWGTMASATHRKMPRVIKDQETARQAESSEAHYRHKYAVRAAGVRPSSKGLLTEVAAARNYVGKTVEEDMPLPPIPRAASQVQSTVPSQGTARPNPHPQQQDKGMPGPTGSAYRGPPYNSTSMGIRGPPAGGVSMNGRVLPGTSPGVHTPMSGHVRPSLQVGTPHYLLQHGPYNGPSQGMNPFAGALSNPHPSYVGPTLPNLPNGALRQQSYYGMAHARR